MYAMLLALLVVQQGQPTNVSGNLSRFVPLIDTLNAVMCTPIKEVRSGVLILARGQYRPGRIVVGEARRFVLLHEFGHYYQANVAPAYYEWADSMSLEAFDREVIEQFADAFARSIDILQEAGRTGWPANDEFPPNDQRRKSDDFLVRRLARRRPFRRRPRRDDEVDLDPLCS